MRIPFKRLLRHLLTTQGEGRAAFPLAALKRLQQVISDGEATHRAEVRLIVEAAMPLGKVWHGVTARQRALELFAQFHVWDTEENNGVLLYVDLADRKVEVVADRAAARAVDAHAWTQICTHLQNHFRDREFETGAATALVAIHALLHEHFPASGADDNLQPDAPIML